MKKRFMALGAAAMAATLKERLRERHADDIFATEALTGSGGSQRFDAWAMEPTWVRDRCCGYEVKVQRSDFLGDKKWTGYLPFCTEFYFVCPAGLIQPDELPREVGLLWGTANAGRIYQKKAAIPGPISPDAVATMLRHVLMWRYGRRQASGRETAQDWIRDMEEGRDLDEKLKGAIRSAAGRRTAEVDAENERLRKQQGVADRVLHWLTVNGVDIDQSEWAILQDVQASIRDRRDAVSKQVRGLLYEIKNLGGRLTELGADIEKELPEAKK